MSSAPVHGHLLTTIVSSKLSWPVNIPENNDSLPSDSSASDLSADPDVSNELPADRNSGVEHQAEPAEDLPEWEPLTPELAEDEAIRGDFMLRWAVILLAVLMGCTEIGESTTLVHIKTGQYLASQGWLPPTNDVFSYTATDQPWTNLSWLFDLLVAGIYWLLGPSGLTIFKTILVALTYYFIVHITKPETSTWSGSILAAMALLVCQLQFTVQPELVTLLGLSLTLWFLHQWKERGSSRSLWFLVLLFLLWSNLDQRMFLGLALLLLYATGEAVGSLLGRPGLPDATHRKRLWISVALCFGAALVNPFTIGSLAAPISLYTIEYPSLRSYHPIFIDIMRSAPIEELLVRLQYYPMYTEEFRSLAGHHAIVGLLVLVTTVITFVLNRSKLDIGYVFAFVGFAGFALAGSHELAAAALVCCVFAAINAQEWYVANFSQTYSVETSELLFSRGGRAVTVLVLFAVAFLTISGRLVGRQGNRIGLGFTDGLQTTLDGLREDLKDSFDDRPFHLRLDQGNQLIWLDQKVFLDSRVALYSARANGKRSLIDLHNSIRNNSLRQASSNVATREGGESNGEDAESKTLWKKTFDQFQVTHVLPRMSGANPDYRTYRDLLASDDWQLTRLGSATAVFYRTDTDQVKLAEYVAAHKVDFLKTAFVTNVEDKSLAPRADWPQSRSAYRSFFSVRTDPLSNSVQEARHYRHYLSQLLNADSDEVLARTSGDQIARPIHVALAYLAIRKANQGLSRTHENAEAFRVLGDMYHFLRETEIQLVKSRGGGFDNEMRMYQAMQAYNQALILEPDHLGIHFALFKLYDTAKKPDLALREVLQYLELTTYTAELTKQESNIRQELVPIQQRLSSMVDQFAEAAAEQIKQKANRLDVAQQTYEAGFVLQALRILQDDQVFLAENPVAQQLRAVCLLESGRVEDASLLFARFEEQRGQFAFLNWRFPAGLSKLARGEYELALPLWNQQIDIHETRLTSTLLQSLPLCESPRLYFGQGQELWPSHQTRSILNSLYTFEDGIENILLDIALCRLEAGHTKLAAEGFHAILDRNPDTILRPLLSFYLFQVTKELVDIPVFSDIFEPSEDSTR